MRDAAIASRAVHHPPLGLGGTTIALTIARLLTAGDGATRLHERGRLRRLFGELVGLGLVGSTASARHECRLEPFEIVSFVITHLETSLRDGSSNITSSSAVSMIERRPRAPVSRSSAFSEIDQRASSVKTRSIVVVGEEPLVLAHERVLRLDQGLPEDITLQLVHGQTTGRRPMNSGISPKLSRSSGITSGQQLRRLVRCFERSSAPKPTAFLPIRGR